MKPLDQRGVRRRSYSPWEAVAAWWPMVSAAVSAVVVAGSCVTTASAQTGYRAGTSENVPVLDGSDRGGSLGGVTIPPYKPSERSVGTSVPAVGSARRSAGENPPAVKPPGRRPDPELRRARPPGREGTAPGNSARVPLPTRTGPPQPPATTIYYTFPVNVVPSGLETYVEGMNPGTGPILPAKFLTRRALQEARLARRTFLIESRVIGGLGTIIVYADQALDAYTTIYQVYEGDRIGALTTGTIAVLRGMTVKYLVAQGGTAIAVALGAPAIVGTGLAAAGGVLLIEFGAKPLLEGTVHFVERYDTLSAVAALVDKAESALADNDIDQALADAIKARQTLAQLRESNSRVGNSSWAASLNDRAVNVQGMVARAHEAVSRTEAIIAGLISDARQGNLQNSGALIRRANQDRPFLRMAGKDKLIQRLDGLSLELPALARAAWAEREKKKRDIETTATASARPPGSPPPNAATPIPRQPQPSPAPPRKASPTPSTLSGRAPWRSADGQRQGTILITIDVAHGRFTAGCYGSFMAEAGKGGFPFAGQFNGAFNGDAARGTIQGTGAIWLTDDTGERAACNIQGRLDGGWLTGTVISPEGTEAFRLAVR